MTSLKVGFLHPGEMGISLAASALESGHSACWVSADRSRETHERARRLDLEDAGTLKRLCATCSVIVSICPPHAAEEVAVQVRDNGFGGLYLDANAISPLRAQRIGNLIELTGAKFVDGGIIGGPALEKGKTRLYLSGADASVAADCFSSGPLKTVIIGDTIGKASALKMCYAANSKGRTALLCATFAIADMLSVRVELEDAWLMQDPEYAEQARATVTKVAAKAWRFAGEMDEIADTFRDAGLPSGFHEAGSHIYRRLADFKGHQTIPDLDTVITALAGHGDA